MAVTLPQQSIVQVYPKPISPGPALFSLPPVSSYTQALDSLDYQNPYLRLYKTKLPTGATWYIADSPTYKAGVQAVPLVLRPGQEPVVRLVITRRAPMGNGGAGFFPAANAKEFGNLTLELPGGGWGDKHPLETATEAVQREVQEELGYHSQVVWPGNNPFAYALAPGMTTQQIAIGVALIDGRQPSTKQWEKDEFFTLAGQLDVPVSVFLKPERFDAWQTKMQSQGFILPVNILSIPTLLRSFIKQSQRASQG